MRSGIFGDRIAPRSFVGAFAEDVERDLAPPAAALVATDANGGHCRRVQIKVEEHLRIRRIAGRKPACVAGAADSGTQFQTHVVCRPGKPGSPQRFRRSVVAGLGNRQYCGWHRLASVAAAALTAAVFMATVLVPAILLSRGRAAVGREGQEDRPKGVHIGYDAL